MSARKIVPRLALVAARGLSETSSYEEAPVQPGAAAIGNPA